MKKKFLRSLSVLFFCFLMLGTNLFAARELLVLPANQTWVSKSTTRTGKYSDVTARLFKVFPYDNRDDDFTRIQARLTSSNGTAISKVYTLYETANVPTAIKLNEGTLDNTNIRMQFRGNNPNYAAYADVFYNGR